LVLPDQTYADSTQGSRDRLRKFSHQTRFDVAISLFDAHSASSILDFGGGDGAFLSLLQSQSKRRFECVLFEPFMDVMPSEDFIHLDVWEAVTNRASDTKFDVVFCQDVMEHFAPHRQEDALARIASVMAPDGKLILSVPVELGPVAVVKNFGRWKYRKGSPEIYTYANILKSLLGRPIPTARSGDDYISHMGFYYTDFRRLLARHFVLEKTVASPFLKLPPAMNSQVFFCARPRSS
jgi:SAM-dependent methyltransferase